MVLFLPLLFLPPWSVHLHNYCHLGLLLPSLITLFPLPYLLSSKLLLLSFPFIPLLFHHLIFLSCLSCLWLFPSINSPVIIFFLCCYCFPIHSSLLTLFSLLFIFAYFSTFHPSFLSTLTHTHTTEAPPIASRRESTVTSPTGDFMLAPSLEISVPTTPTRVTPPLSSRSRSPSPEKEDIWENMIRHR